MCKKILSNQCMQRKIGADKGGLISEGIFSIFVPSSKKGAKSISSTFQTNVKKRLRLVISRIFLRMGSERDKANFTYLGHVSMSKHLPFLIFFKSIFLYVIEKLKPIEFFLLTIFFWYFLHIVPKTDLERIFYTV